MEGTLPSMRGKLLWEAVKKKIKSHGGWGTKFDMSKARVHFFLGILGMLPRFNFLEIRISFGKTCQSWGGGGRLLASVSYCAGWRITSREKKPEVLISLVFQILNLFLHKWTGFYTCEGCIWRAFLLFALSWPTSHADVKCERPSIWNLLLYQKKTKNSSSDLLKGADSAQTVTRKSKGTQPQSPTDLFPDSYLEVYCSPMCL